MDEGLKQLINILQEDRITAKMFEFYGKYENKIDKRWRNPGKFVSYLKAYYIERYLTVSDTAKGLILMNLKEEDDLSIGITQTFLDKINGSVAKLNQNVEGVYLDEFEDLLQLIDDPIYESMEYDDELIMGIIKETQGFVTINEIKDKDTTATGGYEFSKDEIVNIISAKLTPEINKTIHSLYDEATYDGVTCNYNTITDDTAKRFAFHTDCKNPEFKIIFEDGTIVNYKKGDIRLYPIDFFSLTNYIKLLMTYYMKFGDEDEELSFTCELYDLDIDDFLGLNYCDLDDELKEKLVVVAAEDLCSDVDDLLINYSKKMIEDSQKEVTKMNEYVKKYKL